MARLEHIYLSNNVLLNYVFFKDKVEGKIEKVGGNIGKAIFYNWHGWAY